MYFVCEDEEDEQQMNECLSAEDVTEHSEKGQKHHLNNDFTITLIKSNLREREMWKH